MIDNRMKLGALGLFVSGLALAFITTQVDLALVGDALRTADYIYLLPTIGLLFAGLVTRAFRWRLLLAGAMPLHRAFSIMNVAYLVNGVLPLRIGEVARVYLASRLRKPVPIPQTTSTIIVERLLDLLAVVLMVLLALTMGPVPDQLRAVSGIAAVFAIGGFLFLVLLAAQRALAEQLINWLLARLPFMQRLPIANWSQQFLDGLTPLTQPRALLLAFAWTGLSWLLSIAAGYVLMFAFFPEASLAATMLYIAAAAFAIAVPAVPGNIGTYEASILLALSAMGYDEAAAVSVAFAVMVHAVNVFVHASTGVAGFLQEGISLGQLSRGVQQIQQSSGVS